MTEVHIKTLTCVKKQDTVGKDSVVLKIGGRTIGGPYLMAKGDSLSPNVTEPFTSSVQVTLMEEDAGTDDNLGTVTIDDTLPNLRQPGRCLPPSVGGRLSHGVPHPHLSDRPTTHPPGHRAGCVQPEGDRRPDPSVRPNSSSGRRASTAFTAAATRRGAGGIGPD